MAVDVPSLAGGGAIGGFFGGLFWGVHYGPPLVALGTAFVCAVAASVFLAVGGASLNAVGRWR